MGTVAYLLDTHTLLWAVQEDCKLSEKARKAIEDVDSILFVSAISAYEIANKYRIGKLPGYEYVVESYPDIIRRLGADEKPVNTRHASFAGNFEWTHRDPFDRIIAAQAFLDDLILISNDSAFHSLSWVHVLW